MSCQVSPRCLQSLPPAQASVGRHQAQPAGSPPASACLHPHQSQPRSPLGEILCSAHLKEVKLTQTVCLDHCMLTSIFSNLLKIQ